MSYRHRYTLKDYLGIVGAIVLGLLFALAIVGGMLFQQTRFIYIIQ